MIFQQLADGVEQGGAAVLLALQLLGLSVVLVLVALFSSLALHRWLHRKAIR